MTQLIPGTTLCAICNQPIAKATEAIGFPAFVPRGHEFERFSDSAFHRESFQDWEDHERFQKLFDDYDRIWKSRPAGLSLNEMEEWGKNAFKSVFSKGMVNIG
jgi:hypothetical protein